jgi:hypothetical protein
VVGYLRLKRYNVYPSSEVTLAKGEGRSESSQMLPVFVAHGGNKRLLEYFLMVFNCIQSIFSSDLVYFS